MSRVLRRFGCSAPAIFPAGGPNGQMLRTLLKQEDIVATCVPIVQDMRQDFTVTETRSSRQYRFVFPGSGLTHVEAGDLLQAIETIEPAPDFIVASGSLPPDTDVNFFADVARIAKARGARLVLDTSGPSLAAALERPVYLIKPNLHEFRDLIQSSLETETRQLDAARALLREKRVEMIALTLGARGALLVTHENAWRGSAPELEPVSSIGAGDSFLGGLVWRLSSGASNEDALRFALAAGSAALLSPGTGLCQPADIRKLLSEVKVTQV